MNARNTRRMGCLAISCNVCNIQDTSGPDGIVSLSNLGVVQAQKQAVSKPASAFKLQEAEGIEDLLSLMQSMSVDAATPHANGDLASHTAPGAPPLPLQSTLLHGFCSANTQFSMDLETSLLLLLTYIGTFSAWKRGCLHGDAWWTFCMPAHTLASWLDRTCV